MNAIETYHKRAAFPEALQTLAATFQALAHPARLAILLELAQRKACVCGDLVAHLPLAQATVSRHLKELKEAGLVQGELEGSGKCYCLSPTGLALVRVATADLFAQLEAGACQPEAPETCC